MEEKKLTDEDIAKAIVQSIEYSKTITYFDEWGNCKSIFITDILDLIQRLQAENERLKEKFSISHYRDSWKNKFFKAQEEIERLTEELKAKKKECREIADDYQEMGTFYYNETVKTAELKKEIERLTEEHERIAWSKQQYLDWVHGFLTTHTDMKDRGEDYKMFDREWMCNTFWAKIEGSIEYIIDLENQRNELQKQVDDLTASREIQINELHEQHAIVAEEIKQQAVKDTAKEIWNDITSYYFALRVLGNCTVELDKLAEFWHKYGVEVE